MNSSFTTIFLPFSRWMFIVWRLFPSRTFNVALGTPPEFFSVPIGGIRIASASIATEIFIFAHAVSFQVYRSLIDGRWIMMSRCSFSG